jgi:aspartyl-tRNA(Asn)/glutamyl-tRNA(Gln) amidotransferase subunit A
VIDAATLLLSAKELSNQLRARTISPVALTEAYLERASRIGKELNAFAALMPERALDEARQAEKEIAAGKWRGPLHGLPYAAKDLLAARGAPTTWGAKPFQQQRFDEDAPAIAKLRDAGAVLLGKAAMIELAGGFGYRTGRASLTGGVQNPWDRTKWTCGSSSGSGAIVAAGLAAFALGSETWGSILCPSSHCGVTGLRPTHGRVSLKGTMSLSPSMDKIGPMARTASDCSMVLAAISETKFQPGSLRDLRVGWVAAQARGVPDERARSFLEGRKALERVGVTIAEATLPEGAWWSAAAVIISYEAAQSFRALVESGRVAELADPHMRLAGYVASEIAPADYARALKARDRARAAMQAVWRRFDVLAGPATGETAFGLDENLESAFEWPDPMGALGNMLGFPSVSTPLPQVAGLPIGLQLMANENDDAAALTVAVRLQLITDWHRKHPMLH